MTRRLVEPDREAGQSGVPIVETVRERLADIERRLEALHIQLGEVQRSRWGHLEAEEGDILQAEAELAAIRRKLGARHAAGAPPDEVATLVGRERNAAAIVEGKRALLADRIGTMERMQKQISTLADQRRALLTDIGRLEAAAQNLDADYVQLRKRSAVAAHELAAVEHKLRENETQRLAVRRELGLPATP